MELINNIQSIDGSILITFKDNSTELLNGNDISTLLLSQQKKIDELTNFAKESLQIIKSYKKVE